MKTIVAIAGSPREVVDEIKGRPGVRFTGDKESIPLARALKPPMHFRNGMQDAYLSDIADIASKLDPSDDLAVVLAYVDYSGSTTQTFVDHFFPFALTGKIKPFYPEAFPKFERRSRLKKHVDEIEELVSDLRSRTRTVRDVFSGQNFHPLLLPIRNFHSSVLGDKIRALFNELGAVSDTREALTSAASAVLQSHPLKEEKLGKDRAKWFEDDRNLRFKSPGQNRHGMARRVGDGHKPTCLVNSRVRLGGPFDPRFHYDCEYSRRALDATYPNCHSVPIAPAATTHVNIAPNDYVR